MKTKIILLFVVITANIYSQGLEYKVLSNEPPQTPRLSINTDLFQLDMLQHSLEAMSVNASVWGHYEISPEHLGAQFLYRRSWFAFGRLGEKEFSPNSEIEIGGYFVLRNSAPLKDTKITLQTEYGGTSYSTNYRGESTYSYSVTETFIIVPSEKKRLTMARGGFYSKSHGNSMRYLGDAYNYSNNPEYLKFSSAGIYAGINLRTLTSIFIDSKDYGIQFNSLGRDLYADILLLPVNRFKNLDGENISEDVKQFTNSLPIGFRAGYRLFQIDKKAKTGKTFGLCATFEAGVRPYTGVFISSGIGLTFMK